MDGYGMAASGARKTTFAPISAMYKLVCKMPVVTGDLIAHPINLPSWLSDKKPPPFSHPTRARHSR
jgi:hypothetical protein